MIKKLIKTIIEAIRQKITLLRFRWRLYKRGGVCGKGLRLSHLKFVEFDKLRIKSGFRIDCYPVFAGIKNAPPRLKIFNNVIIGYNFTALVADTIQIGSNTILASNVSLVSENHGINVETNVPFYAQKLETGPISIGKGCWIGQNVTVMPNVKIGDKCVIGANSVVTKDIPSYSIAVGMPAKVIKRYDFELHSWVKV